MNVLYLHKKSKWGNELKYSLRSVEKYVKYDKVYVVGHRPEWLMNAVHIPHNTLDNRFKDVNDKLKLALQFIPKMSHVLLMHDDMFLLKPYSPCQYYNGTFDEAETGGGRKKAYENTRPYLSEGAKNYGLHYPMPFTNCIEWNYDQPLSYMNLLGDYFDYDKQEVEDCKFHNEAITKKKLEGLPCFSTASENDRLLHLFEQLYPNKSTFER